MVPNRVKLLTSIDNIVLKHDTSYCLIASISFHGSLEGPIELGEDGSGAESYLEFVEALLFYMSSSEWNNFCQLDEGLYFSTAIHHKYIVIVSKV